MNLFIENIWYKMTTNKKLIDDINRAKSLNKLIIWSGLFGFIVGCMITVLVLYYW